jgi:hypothetical protein
MVSFMFPFIFRMGTRADDVERGRSGLFDGSESIQFTDMIKLRLGGGNSSLPRSRTTCHPPSSRNRDRVRLQS